MSIIYPSFFDKSAEKFPYVYHERPFVQIERKLSYHSPYLGIDRVLTYSPREEYGRSFDNVRGIKVHDGLIVLREILFNGAFPGDIREIIKQFPGRLPNESEMQLVFENRSSVCNNLLELGEQPLLERRYLYHKGDGQDEVFNYCLDFHTGKLAIADCDDWVSAFLVA